MIKKISSCMIWLPAYFWDSLKRNILNILQDRRPRHLYFCICDHYEPYVDKADSKTARRRIQRWVDEYPKIAEKFPDSEGNLLKYSFFYPEEDYRFDDIEALAGLCREGYGEVEVHLHHDNDTSENLRRTLLDYKRRLHEDHGLLSVDRDTGEIVYGFIHGNWALDNSRPDGRWCGVNDEITILQETGCYADFTMPSAPSPTQTRKVNSIYYAVDDPRKPKSHDRGRNARVGEAGKGLLMVQGPLALDWKRRKYGILPRLETSGLYSVTEIDVSKVNAWVKQRIHVQGDTDHIFVKLYTHGAKDVNMEKLLGGGLEAIFTSLDWFCLAKGMRLHHVSAREMVNKIHELESGTSALGAEDEQRYVSNINRSLPGEAA